MLLLTAFPAAALPSPSYFSSRDTAAKGEGVCGATTPTIIPYYSPLLAVVYTKRQIDLALSPGCNNYQIRRAY